LWNGTFVSVGLVGVDGTTGSYLSTDVFEMGYSLTANSTTTVDIVYKINGKVIRTTTVPINTTPWF